MEYSYKYSYKLKYITYITIHRIKLKAIFELSLRGGVLWKLPKHIEKGAMAP